MKSEYSTTEDSFSRFQYGIKSEETLRKYVKRLELFLDFNKFDGETISEKAEDFLKFAKKNDPEKTTDVILKYMSYHVNRATQKLISKSTVRNFYKPIKLFCDMNSIIFNSKVVARGIPSGLESSNDRIPTREEILEMLKYPDRRLRAIAFTMLSCGMRVGAWEYLKWKNIVPVYDVNKKIIAAKIIIYDGEPERYFSFITPEAYYELSEWMDFRSSQGEKITGESWLMRDLWNTGQIIVKSKDSNLTKGASGIASSPKRADVDSIRMVFNRAWRIQNVRTFTLDMNKKRRHEFKGTHSLRKYFETHALSHMKLLNVKMLMGHDSGLDRSYFKPTEKEMLEDYLEVVDLLTISNENKLRNAVESDLEEKEQEIESMKLQYENEIKELRKDMEEKFTTIFQKVNIDKLIKKSN